MEARKLCNAFLCCLGTKTKQSLCATHELLYNVLGRGQNVILSLFCYFVFCCLRRWAVLWWRSCVTLEPFLPVTFSKSHELPIPYFYGFQSWGSVLGFGPPPPLCKTRHYLLTLTCSAPSPSMPNPLTIILLHGLHCFLLLVVPRLSYSYLTVALLMCNIRTR